MFNITYQYLLNYAHISIFNELHLLKLRKTKIWMKNKIKRDNFIPYTKKCFIKFSGNIFIFLKIIKVLFILIDVT